MGSMDEVDTAYLNQRIAQLESNQKLQADLYLIERSTGRRWSSLWGIFQVLWLLTCTVLITVILTDHIPEIHNKVDILDTKMFKERVPVGTIMAWNSTEEPPEGREKAIVLIAIPPTLQTLYNSFHTYTYKPPELREELTITSDFSLKGWMRCDGSRITDGKWKGETTPNLTGTFLMGRDTDNPASYNQRINQETFVGKLDEEVDNEKKNTTAGFCFHNRNLTTGCMIGNRYKNHIEVNVPSLTLSPYLPTYQVDYIIKCW